MKPEHACEGCKYHFVGTVDKTEMVYSGLQDAMVSITGKVRRHMCGYNPGGVVLNDKAPTCTNYIKIKESA